MRKVTTSAVILTALTGCGQSNVPSAQWSFEVPVNSSELQSERVATDSTLAQQPGRELFAPLTAEGSSLTGGSTSDKMGPAFEQPLASSQTGLSSVSTIAAQTLQTSEGSTSGDIAVPSLLPRDSVTQAYVNASPPAPRFNYAPPVSRTPFSAQTYLPTSPSYSSPASASANSVASLPFAESTPSTPFAESLTSAAAVTYPSDSSSSLLNPPSLAQDTLPTLEDSSTPVLLSTAAADVTAVQNAFPQVDTEADALERLALSEPSSIAVPVSRAVSDEVALNETTLDEVAFDEAVPIEVAPVEVALNESAFTDGVTLDRLLQTLPRDSEPAILSIIRADQQNAQLTTAVSAEQMPTLTSLEPTSFELNPAELVSPEPTNTDLNAVEPAAERDITAMPTNVSPLLEQLPSVANASPLQAVYVPIPETASVETPAAFILEAIAALSEEASAASVPAIVGTQLSPTLAQSPSSELVSNASSEANPVAFPSSNLVRLDAPDAPATKMQTDIVDITPTGIMPIDIMIEPAKMTQASRKGAVSALATTRLQAGKYRQRLVWH